MKKIVRRFGALPLTALLLLALGLPALADAPAYTPPELTILFTHDTHDHFYPDAAGVGGYVRLATLLEQEREKAGWNVVTVDAGDFSMGSPFQTVYATDAPELRALGEMGYDVTTFGNHEYDYRPQGLANMLNAAVEAVEAETRYSRQTPRLPAIVQANYKTPKDPVDPASQAMVEAMENYPVTDYTVIDRFDNSSLAAFADQRPLRIAVFGIMGLDSDECAPMSGTVLEDPIETAKRVVAEIREREKPDYIICLSHSGTEDGKGEDYELAKAVDGIDVIISGHTHTTLEEPIEVNGTFIVSCGPYTRNLGRLTIGRSPKDGAVTALDYALLPIDGSVAEDGGMAALAEGFKAKVDENYLSQYHMSYDQVLATSKGDFTKAQTGDFIGEAYIAAVKELEGENYAPIAFAVAPDGVVRGSVKKGDITASQAFDILSLGVGADGTPGYPLVSVYLTGRDLKNTFEVDASISDIMGAARLYGAGSHWEYNPRRMFLDRVTGSHILTSGIDREIDDDTLYRVVADLYSGQMLGAVKGKSFGLLSITPRNADGSEVSDFEECILHDGNGSEIKAWHAFASYLRAKGDGLAPAPMSKTVVDSFHPLNLLFPMGVPTAVALAVVLLLVLAIALIVRKLLRRRKGKDGFAPPYRGR